MRWINKARESGIPISWLVKSELLSLSEYITSLWKARSGRPEELLPRYLPDSGPTRWGMDAVVGRKYSSSGPSVRCLFDGSFFIFRDGHWVARRTVGKQFRVVFGGAGETLTLRMFWVARSIG